MALSKEDVDRAAAKYLSLQDQVRGLKDGGSGTKTLENYHAARKELDQVRAAYRQQEETAGRRTGLVVVTTNGG